tara:strand:+ start:726 stop:989 length:264 start_codon:yes stop_codon:yes gene_type:complete
MKPLKKEIYASLAKIVADGLGLTEMSRAGFERGVEQEGEDHKSGGKTAAANKAEREARKKASKTGKSSSSAGYADAARKRRALVKKK